MERVEQLRNRLDRLFNKTIYRLVGAIIICYVAKTLLTTSMFTSLAQWAIAVVTGALFLWQPAAAILAEACVLFLSLAHINALALLVLVVLMLFFCGCNQEAAFWAICLPVAFLPGNLLSGLQVLIFLTGLCVMSRMQSVKVCVAFGLQYAVLALLTVSESFGNVFYTGGRFVYNGVYFRTAQLYFHGLNFSRMYHTLVSHSLTVTAVAIALCAVFAVAVACLFRKLRIPRKYMVFDVADAARFAAVIVLYVVLSFGVAKLYHVTWTLEIWKAVLSGVMAYLVSRPFVSDEICYRLNTNGGKPEAANTAVTNAAITLDKWESIAGYEETKKEIQTAIRPYTDHREYEKLARAGLEPVKGLLLFGPPGTGKTTIARIIANETKMKLIVVNASSFLSMYVGESEKNLVSIFKEARNKAPCMICFDEIEAFLMDRSKAERSYETSIVTTFLSQMDGFSKLHNVLIVATTNNPTLIDPAALRPGRFDKLIYVGVPDQEARAVMFEKYLKGKTTGEVSCEKLAEYSERFTGADIRGLCETAYRENDFKPVTEEQLLMRLSNTRSSYTLEMQKTYNLWSKKYNRTSIAQEDNQNKSAKKLTWDDIKGMGDIKTLLKEKIELPIVNAEQYKQYNISAPKGILFFGPPGCGKTFFAKVVADESNAAFYTVNGPELLGRGVGESEENLRRVFMDARETKPSIIFFDEIDAIAEARNGQGGNVRLINQLLTEMDGMESLSGVTVIAATNRPDSLDPALLRAGRFDTKIYIPLPDRESIRQMVVGYLGDVPCDADIDAVTEALVGYTCADVAAAVNKAKVLYVQRKLAGREDPLHGEEILGIIARTKSSVSPEDAARYEKQRELESWA